MKLGVALVIALSLGACAHASGHEMRSASVTLLHAPQPRSSRPDAPATLVIKSRRCLLGHNDRAAVLASLGRLQPAIEQEDVDFHVRDAPEQPSAGSGLLVVFARKDGPVLTATMQASAPRDGERDAYIRVNGRLARISADDLAMVQGAAARSGCPISLTHGKAA